MRGIGLVVDRVDSTGIVHCKAHDDPQLQGINIPMEPLRLVKSILASCLSVASLIKIMLQ